MQSCIAGVMEWWMRASQSSLVLITVLSVVVAMMFGGEGMSADTPQASNSSAESQRPAWIGSQAGISDRVLPPWTPLEVYQEARLLRVACWGRTYEFDNTPFPRSIRTAGKSVLSAPVRVTARVAGTPLAIWLAGDVRLVEKSPHRVRLSQKKSSNDLILSAETTIEYDGMMLIEWQVTAQRPVTLTELTFEVPLKPEHAKYLYYYPHYERSWSEHRPGALKPEGFVDDFRPVMWLGDEERGLEWFTESDENWFSDEPDRVTEVKREGDRVVLRLRVVTKPVELAPDGPRPSLSYTFGLEATPVKPVEKDAWDYRTFHVSQGTFGVQTRLDIPDSELDKLAAAGVRTVAFHEHWTDIESYTTTTYGSQLRRLAEACHKRGMQLNIYFGFLISDLAPEWKEYGDECVLEPRRGYTPYNYPPQPLQNAYIVCYRSVWQDFLADGIARALAEYGVDGVYLDGTADPFEGCRNRRHGCGYVKPDGAVAPTYAILPIRSMMRRIYAIVQAHRPDGQVNTHQSAFMVMPTLAWATSYWDGEQLPGRGDARATLSLDGFRAEFMGHQWGVPAEFLVPAPFEFRQACGLALLHDVPVRAVSTGADLGLMSSLWRIFDDFGRKDAEWLPYWRNSDYVSAAPADLVVSLYRHSKHGVLMEVFNAGPGEVSGEVTLNLNALKLKAAAAHDALTGDAIALDGGKLQLTLSSLGWRLLWVTAGAGTR
jgi:hypothetical protein